MASRKTIAAEITDMDNPNETLPESETTTAPIKKTAKASTKGTRKPASKTTRAKSAKTSAKATTAKAATAKSAKPKAPKSKTKAVVKKKVAAKSSKDEGGEESDAPKARKYNAENSLVIVESPAKAKTIKKYLGAGYVVKASVGHVKDLPKKKIGIDIKKNFKPEYVVIDGKKKVLAEIKEAAASVGKVFLAPDPDREGEAIAWHIADEIRPHNPNIYRVLFNEITKRAVHEAIARPTELDVKKYESQQARRILDRLVGYQISPVLWTKVRRGLSAGRVQSVAVRLVVEREADIAAFKPEEYWTIEATVEGSVPPPFVARVVKHKGEKVDLTQEGPTRALVDELTSSPLKVSSVERKERRKFAPPPFITSRLQQEAASKLRFSPKKTMSLAQRLYEGVELGGEGPVGLITYMRTDSTRVSDDAIREVRTYIAERYGANSVPATPPVYKSKKSAQDAHEAIRPTAMTYDPDTVRKLWGQKGGGRDPQETEDLMKLYSLIWNRFVACQMIPAVFDQTTVEIEAGAVGLRATGQVMKVSGYLEVYSETMDDVTSDEGSSALPEVKEGEILKLLDTKPEQHFTQPPPRFSEATLVRELEEKGIGRPSTYAAILSTIQDRGYAEKKEGRLFPTELGTMVNGLLVTSFPEIVNADFTAQLEADLDRVEEGEVDWVNVLKGFYGPFSAEVEKAKVEMRDLKAEEQPTDIICEKCSKNLVIKWGRNGHFLACSGYPECRNTKEYVKAEDGTLTIVETTKQTDQICPNCSSPMLQRRGRFGEFLACSKYPECKTTSPISLGVNCPKPDCGGFLTAKRSRKGKAFYGCSNYGKTKCDFVSWDRPLAKPCPQCNAPFIVEKISKAGARLRCIVVGCGYSTEPASSEGVEPASSGSSTAGTASAV